jgi:hypothetical protein
MRLADAEGNTTTAVARRLISLGIAQVSRSNASATSAGNPASEPADPRGPGAAA